ncbi:DDE superfamily endonuclease [Popillia japonica]|uniref:DDE superfamily endonuclease n=1 Tax=Popillia japonica TaxID=7064 RepID=A0AAW1HT22_POPJA
MDGKHVVVQCPANSGSKYYNYKGTFSIVLLALVDNNYNLSCINIGSYGSYSYERIFAKSALQKAVEENSLNIPTGSVILRDEEFPLKTYLMKPYLSNYLVELDSVTVLSGQHESDYQPVYTRRVLR